SPYIVEAISKDPEYARKDNPYAGVSTPERISTDTNQRYLDARSSPSSRYIKRLSSSAIKPKRQATPVLFDLNKLVVFSLLVPSELPVSFEMGQTAREPPPGAAHTGPVPGTKPTRSDPS